MADSYTTEYVSMDGEWKIGAFTSEEDQFPPLEYYQSEDPLSGIDKEVWSRLQNVKKEAAARFLSIQCTVFSLACIFPLVGVGVTAVIAASISIPSNMIQSSLLTVLLIYMVLTPFSAFWLQRHWAANIHRDMHSFAQREAPNFEVNHFALKYVETNDFFIIGGYFELTKTRQSDKERETETEKKTTENDGIMLELDDTSMRIHVAGRRAPGTISLHDQYQQQQHHNQKHRQKKQRLAVTNPQLHMFLTGVIGPHFSTPLRQLRLYQVWILLALAMALFVLVVCVDCLVESGALHGFLMLAFNLLAIASVLVAFQRVPSYHQQQLQDAAEKLPKFGRYRFVLQKEATSMSDSLFLQAVPDENLEP